MHNLNTLKSLERNINFGINQHASRRKHDGRISLLCRRVRRETIRRLSRISWQQPSDDPLEIRIHTYAVEDFYFRRLIGQGSFSTVHCVFSKADGFNVASRKVRRGWSKGLPSSALRKM
jgi:hypothetical protein